MASQRSISSSDEVIRPIVGARIVNTALGFERIVYALLDTGSDRDVISPSIVAELRLETWTEVLTVQTLDNLVSGERSLTAMMVESINRKYSAMVKRALVGRLLAGNGDVPRRSGIHSPSGGPALRRSQRQSGSDNWRSPCGNMVGKGT